MKWLLLAENIVLLEKFHFLAQNSVLLGILWYGLEFLVLAANTVLLQYFWLK